MFYAINLRLACKLQQNWLANFNKISLRFTGSQWGIIPILLHLWQLSILLLGSILALTLKSSKMTRPASTWSLPSPISMCCLWNLWIWSCCRNLHCLFEMTDNEETHCEGLLGCCGTPSPERQWNLPPIRDEVVMYFLLEYTQGISILLETTWSPFIALCSSSSLGFNVWCFNVEYCSTD